MRKTKYFLFIILVFAFLFIFNKVNAIEELPDNGAKISSSQIIQTKTGTGPFDVNNDPGNDSSENNNIVRSFDQVTWTIENTMVLNNSEATGYTGGKIYFQATLPSEISTDEIKWDTESMGWIEDVNISSNGKVLTGYYQMSSENITIPGKQTLVFIVKVLGARNGSVIKPDIKVWLNGNSDEEKVTTSEIENVYISSAPSYNVKLSRNSYCSKRLTVDYDSQEVTGRIYGYSFIVQLYNDKEKGLKGIEFPKGDITFDLDLKFERSNVNGTGLEDITNNCTPLLWNYKVNNSGGKGVIENRAMSWTNADEGYNLRGAPYGVIKSDRNNSIYNSGNVIMQQNGSKITVTLKDYKFDGIFPQYNGEYSKNTIIYTDNIGCFSSWYFQILVPDNEYSIQENSNYYLTVSDSNMKAKSLTDQSMSNQKVTTDDKLQVNHVRFSPGKYDHFIDIQAVDGNPIIGLTNRGRGGDTVLTNGNKFNACLTFSINNGADEEAYIYSANEIFKFDGLGLEPSSDHIVYSSSSTLKFNAYYLTKKDGTNWSSQEEMNSMCNIEEFNIYKNKSDIPEGYICVGLFFESKEGGNVKPLWSTIYVEMKVKNSAIINQTYGMTLASKWWAKENQLDRDIYTIENKDISIDDYPTPSWTKENKPYIKTEYDEDGSIISGTHNGSYQYGNTIYVVGANQTVQVTTIDDAGNEKLNYDFGKNEYDINFKIEPILSSESDNIKMDGITVTITDTLPKGLTYISGSSNYNEPQIIINDDGTTTLIWNIYDCVVEEKIEPITFLAHIDEETANGTQFTNKAIISADKIGNGKEIFRTDSTTIQIINLSSHRLYKIVETPVIEKNGEIHYTISYKNNTDGTIPDFQMLDILPYNGDGRGTEYTGSYTLDRLVVTQINGDGEEISNENLKILYTEDESVRGSISSKDENLGEGWKEAKAETIKQSVAAYVVKGEIGAQSSVTVDIYIKTENNKGLDKYVNSATAQVYKDTEEMTTSNAVSQVVERKIEGVAWEDKNSNGVIDEGEELLKNVEVTLTNDQGEQVTDVNGNVVSSVRTDEKGYYKFVNLPRENYYIMVSIPSSKYELTEKEVGTNNEINSKFDVEERETDEITKLNTIDLPELTVSNVNAGFVKKETKVVVNYKEIGTNNKLYDEVTINGRIDDEYTTENKLDEINENNGNKYEYVRVEGTTTGTMTEDTIYVTYWYQKKATKVKVLHVLEGTDVSNPENVTDVLYPTEEITGRVDDSYSTQNRLSEINENSQIEYELVTDNVLNKTGQMTVDTIYVVYEYRTIPATIKIEHKDIDTDEELMETVTEDGMVGEEYTTTNKLDEINTKYENKYELVSEPENKDGKYKREEQTITYYYQKKIGEVEVNYLEVGTEKVLASQEILKDKVDKEYTTENKLDEINANNDNKYEFVKTTGDPTEGIYKIEKQIVNYYYQKKAAKVKVLHVLEGTDVSNPENVTDVLYPTEELTGRVDDNYTTQNRLEEINKNSKVQYDLVTDEVEGKTGQMTIDTIYVVYEYRKAPATIKIEHKDIDTNEELMETVTEDGIVGEEYTTTNKLDEINAIYENKYELVSEPENKEGEYKREEQIITYYYRKKPANVIVKYVDVDTEEELMEGEEIVGRVDDEYKTIDKIKEINENRENKYVLVKTTENTEGKMGLETIEVIYYYKKVEAQVIVIHKDEETGEEIADRDYIGGYVGDGYTTSEKEIDGYEIVIEKIPLNKEGEMEEEIIEVIYYYKKIPKVENIDTGDIAVYAVASVSVVCIAGIVCVVLKSKKK